MKQQIALKDYLFTNHDLYKWWNGENLDDAVYNVYKTISNDREYTVNTNEKEVEDTLVKEAMCLWEQHDKHMTLFLAMGLLELGFISNHDFGRWYQKNYL